MSNKSSSSSPAKAISRPVSRESRSKARQLAEAYQVILIFEDGCWHGRGLELPHVYGEGSTPEACVADTRKAFEAAIAYLLEQEQRPPTPAREGGRSMQVNVRVTAEEKALLEATARRKGYSGLSDFIRAAALESAR